MALWCDKISCYTNWRNYMLVLINLHISLNKSRISNTTYQSKIGTHRNLYRSLAVVEVCEMVQADQKTSKQSQNKHQQVQIYRWTNYRNQQTRIFVMWSFFHLYHNKLQINKLSEPANTQFCHVIFFHLYHEYTYTPTVLYLRVQNII